MLIEALCMNWKQKGNMVPLFWSVVAAAVWWSWVTEKRCREKKKGGRR